MILIFIFCTLPCLMAATVKSTKVADLKQQVDAGIMRHLAMTRELPNWLNEYGTKRIDLENVMKETTICTRRAWIREKIRNLEELYEKIKLTWDLKGEQLVTLTQVLHHGNYSNTGLKDFGPDDENDEECEKVLKSLDHYLKMAKETHVEEGNRTEIYKQELDDKLEWWRTQACDCILTEWGSWSECTKTCGEGENAGTTKRTRTVSQDALNNGTCSGSSEEGKKCNNVCCPVDCTWNQWSEWTKCEEKCPVSQEDGKVHRYRSENEHQCGGAHCQGDSEETKTCHIIDIMQDKIEGLQDKITNLKHNTTPKVKRACEHQNLALECPSGTTIKIVSANYGRTNDGYCQFANGSWEYVNCASKQPGTNDKVRNECDRKQQCGISASNDVFGEDPCPGTNKYLEVLYVCE